MALVHYIFLTLSNLQFPSYSFFLSLHLIPYLFSLLFFILSLPFHHYLFLPPSIIPLRSTSPFTFTYIHIYRFFLCTPLDVFPFVIFLILSCLAFSHHSVSFCFHSYLPPSNYSGPSFSLLLSRSLYNFPYIPFLKSHHLFLHICLSSHSCFHPL